MRAFFSFSASLINVVSYISGGWEERAERLTGGVLAERLTGGELASGVAKVKVLGMLASLRGVKLAVGRATLLGVSGSIGPSAR